MKYLANGTDIFPTSRTDPWWRNGFDDWVDALDALACDAIL